MSQHHQGPDVFDTRFSLPLKAMGQGQDPAIIITSKVRRRFLCINFRLGGGTFIARESRVFPCFQRDLKPTKLPNLGA